LQRAVLWQATADKRARSGHKARRSDRARMAASLVESWVGARLAVDAAQDFHSVHMKGSTPSSGDPSRTRSILPKSRPCLKHKCSDARPRRRSKLPQMRRTQKRIAGFRVPNSQHDFAEHQPQSLGVSAPCPHCRRDSTKLKESSSSSGSCSGTVSLRGSGPKVSSIALSIGSAPAVACDAIAGSGCLTGSGHF
jgi:hypothetical protein